MQPAHRDPELQLLTQHPHRSRLTKTPSNKPASQPDQTPLLPFDQDILNPATLAHAAAEINGTRPGPTAGRKWWVCFSWLVTFWAFPACLSACGKKSKDVQQAWREKVALCFIILLCGGVMAFVTFGLNLGVCTHKDVGRIPFFSLNYGTTSIRGQVYSVQSLVQAFSIFSSSYNDLATAQGYLGSRDASAFFMPDATQCSSPLGWTCTVQPCNGDYQNIPSVLAKIKNNGCASYLWSDVQSRGSTLLVYNGAVMNMAPFFQYYPSAGMSPFGKAFDEAILRNLGGDATWELSATGNLQAIKCIQAYYQIGCVDKLTVGCFASDTILYVSLVITTGIIVARFVMAIVFSWIIAPGLKSRVKIRRNRRANPALSTTAPSQQGQPFIPADRSESLARIPGSSTVLHVPGFDDLEGASDGEALHEIDAKDGMIIRDPKKLAQPQGKYDLDGDPLKIIMLVTCYSEGRESIKSTLDSLAGTRYPNTSKMLYVVADGLVTGSGNNQSTPDIVLDLIELDEAPKDYPLENDPLYDFEAPREFLAVAEGKKRVNKARCYRGYYTPDMPNGGKGEKCPVLVIVKCGTDEERADSNNKKPGNRGKRDSQLVLMQWLGRILFNDRMTELDYWMFTSSRKLMGFTPDEFEAVLMVDADTRVDGECLVHMSSVMRRDPRVMGLCGETKVLNKKQSWVTAIQVFEYHVSHHFGKAFEAFFGGVTCLPGCFSMYRIKTPKEVEVRKGQKVREWVPILVNPEIVGQYSETYVDTLHKKNLLLLGEDRFLSTLMLRIFPTRKTTFVPKATCYTVVPDEFNVLLSQRRRWINSTIHNLMELVLVDKLCGTFCCSMQFVVGMDLFGTAVLPFSVGFLVYFIVQSISGPLFIAQLMMMIIILMLPAVLILLTTRKLEYIGWMFIYFAAIPIWNLVLPLYAFWRFDDFSWGQTRMVSGETKPSSHADDSGGGKGAVQTGLDVRLRRWDDWERDYLAMRRELERIKRLEQEAEERVRARLAAERKMRGDNRSGGVGGLDDYPLGEREREERQIAQMEQEIEQRLRREMEEKDALARALKQKSEAERAAKLAAEKLAAEVALAEREAMRQEAERIAAQKAKEQEAELEAAAALARKAAAEAEEARRAIARERERQAREEANVRAAMVTVDVPLPVVSTAAFSGASVPPAPEVTLSSEVVVLVPPPVPPKRSPVREAKPAVLVGGTIANTTTARSSGGGNGGWQRQGAGWTNSSAWSSGGSVGRTGALTMSTNTAAGGRSRAVQRSGGAGVGNSQGLEDVECHIVKGARLPKPRVWEGTRLGK